MGKVKPRAAGRGGARPGAGRPRSDRDDVTVRLDRQVAAQARFVAESRGVTLAEYLTESVRPIVAKDFGRSAEKLNDSAGE